MDLSTNEELARVEGFCPLPVGSTVLIRGESRTVVHEFQVLENRLTVGSDATLVLYCADLQSTKPKGPTIMIPPEIEE
jgi:hypothetical protein